MSDYTRDNLREAIPLLRRPFTAEAVKFKVQAVLGENQGGLIVAYIDARLAGERLNTVVPHLWSDEYEVLGKSLRCRITVDGVTREDIGEGQGKALYSDAFKRAAVKFGVGVSLYAIPQQKMWAGEKPEQLRLQKGGKRSPVIDDRSEAWLREQYGRWLGRQEFGEPLDHGDAAGSQGDHEAVEIDTETGEVVEASSNGSTKAGGAQVEAIRASMHRLGPQAPKLSELAALVGMDPPPENVDDVWRRLTPKQAADMQAALDAVIT